MNNDEVLLGVLVGFLVIAAIKNNAFDFNSMELILIVILGLTLLLILGIYYWKYFSKKGREQKSKNDLIADIPESLKHKSDNAIHLGLESDLNIPIYLTDQLRSRHVHILGATGSGKTESVILNFLKQDIERGLGAVILDAKGDQSFIDHLRSWVPLDKLKVFDLSDVNSMGFDPLKQGSPLEAAQRIFSSLIWSEEFYKSKALSALQAAFAFHFF
jgi:DNA helicase HerA-like ATPase